MLDYNAKSIKSMEGLEHVRARAGMWGFVPDTTQGNLMQIKETLDNSVDECREATHQYLIEITFYVKGNNYQVSVRDYGRGIPLEKLKDIFMRLFTSGKYEDGAYEDTVGTNGVGSKVTAALSKRFVAITKRPDGFGYLEIKQGKLVDQVLKKGKLDNSNRTNGTIVFLEPDPTILKATNEFIPTNGIQQHIDLCQFIDTFSKNITIVVRKVDKLIPESFWKQDRVAIWTELTKENGTPIYTTDPDKTPISYVQDIFGLNKNITWELGKLFKVQRTENTEDRLGFDIELFMDERSAAKHGILAAINRTPIDRADSSHMKVLNLMLKQQLVGFIDDKEVKLFFENMYVLPISGSVMVKWRRAAFVGQDKRQFQDTEFEQAFRSALRKQLTSKPDAVWERLFELIADDLSDKFNRYFNRNMKLGKGLKDLNLNYPNSYHKCVSKDSSMIELFIAEGDSAGGHVKSNRNQVNQAVYKLRGKPTNTMKGPGDRYRENLIFKDLVTLIGVSRRDPNLDNMNFARIIITTDADHDGKHIASLILAMLYTIHPKIVEEGRVYIANPPLYGIVTKNRTVFLRDQSAMDDIRIGTLYNELFEIDLEVGKECAPLRGEAFTALCRRVMRIGRIASNLSKILNVSPRTMERLLHVIDLIDGDSKKLPQLCEILSIDSAVYQQATNSLTLVVDQFEEVIPLDNLVNELRINLLPEYEAIHWKKINLYCTTKHSELYIHDPTTPIKLFEEFSVLDNIFSLERYKGLGEMSDEDLEYTCINPATRCFTKITSLGSLDRIYDMLGVNSDARKKLVNSQYVTSEDDLADAAADL